MNSTVTISISALAALLGSLPSDPATPPLVCESCDHPALQPTDALGEGVEHGWGPPAWPDETEASQVDFETDTETPPSAAQVVAPAFITDSSSTTQANPTAIAPAGVTPLFARGLMTTRTNIALDDLNLDVPPDNANTGTWYVITQGRWIGVHNNL